MWFANEKRHTTPFFNSESKFLKLFVFLGGGLKKKKKQKANKLVVSGGNPAERGPENEPFASLSS